MKRILVPLDYSENSFRALSWAAGLAVASGANIIVHHSFAPTLSEEKYEKKEKETYKKLNGICHSLKADPETEKVPCEVSVMCGEAVSTIIEAADHHHAEIIVMGTRGVGSFDGIFPGSTATDVIRNSDYPVLAIPEKMMYAPLQRILFATDDHFLKQDITVQFLMDFAQLFAKDIRVLNIAQSESEIIYEANLANEADQFLFDHEIKHSFDTVINHDPTEGLNDYLSEHGDVSILAMMPELFEKIYLLHSESSATGLYTQIPVMVLK